MATGMTISRAAERLGVGIETIRFYERLYERRGLIKQPPQPDLGERPYPSETVARIRFIREKQ